MSREQGRRFCAAAALACAIATNCAAATAATDMNKQQLAAQLPLIAERTIAWAKDREAASLAAGTPLTHEQLMLARAVGVKHPERIRIVVVNEIPLPDEPVLRAAAQGVGLSQSWAAGLTLGHAVMLHRGFEHEVRLLSHEFRHVAQYESMSGIGPFLVSHLKSLAEVGYEDSPFERDARAHER